MIRLINFSILALISLTNKSKFGTRQLHQWWHETLFWTQEAWFRLWYLLLHRHYTCYRVGQTWARRALEELSSNNTSRIAMAIVYLSKSPRQMDNIVRSLPDKCTSPRPALPVVSSYVFSFTYFVSSLLYSVFIFSSRCETIEVSVADSGLKTWLLLC